MLSFKAFLRESEKKKQEDNDKNVRVGFASIHKSDHEVDKLLPNGLNQPKEENIVGNTVNEDKHVHAFEHAVNSRIEEEKPIKTNYHSADTIGHHNLAPDAIKSDSHIDKHYVDTIRSRLKPFYHHIDINNKVEKHYDLSGKRVNYGTNYGGRSDKSPLVRYTANSKALNRHLIKKHTDSDYANYHHGVIKTKKASELPDDNPHAQQFNKIEERHYHRTLARHDKEIHSLLNRKYNKLAHSAIVHSGVGENMTKVLHHTRNGDVIHMPAYTSTSLVHKTAYDFGHHEYDPEKVTRNEKGNVIKVENGHVTHMMHFHLPKGYTRARYVDNIFKNDGEHEVVLDKDQKFRKVHEHTTVNRNTRHYTDVEPIEHHTDTKIVHHHFVPVE